MTPGEDPPEALLCSLLGTENQGSFLKSSQSLIMREKVGIHT